MRWILLDLAIALVALGVLAVLVRRLWRDVKALGAAVASAGDTIAAATDALAAAQAEGPLGGAPAGAGTYGRDMRYERELRHEREMSPGRARRGPQDPPRTPAGA